MYNPIAGTTMRKRLGLTTLVIMAFGYGLLVAQSGRSKSEWSDGALYLVGGRQALRIDLQTGATKVWQLLTQVGMKEGDLCSARHAPQSCDWYASETLLDLRNKRLYFAAPTTSPGDDIDSDTDENMRGPFAVWTLDLESMKLLKRLDTSSPPEAMVLTPDGKQLLVSYGPNLIVDIFDTSTFAKISSVKNTGGNQLDTYFTAGSYFLPNGKFIIGGGVGADFRIQVDAGHFKEEFVDPRTQLPPDELKKLSGFVKTEKDGQKLLPAVPVSSRNGKTLVSVADEAQPERLSGPWIWKRGQPRQQSSSVITRRRS